MKCASATAGIASVVTGLAVVLSSAPAHSTFLYLNQSQLISAAISASGVATSSGGSPTTLIDAHYGEHLLPVADEATSSDADPANAPITYAGTQQQVSAYGDDVGDGQSAGYYSGLRWWSPRSATRVDHALPRHRVEASARPGSSSPVTTSPSKDSPTGSGSVTPPSGSAPSVTTPSAPAVNPPVSTPSVPSVGGSPPPVNTSPIGSSPPPVETPIVGLPSRSVPEPSTVGLLGIGLLLAFVGLGRNKRAR